MKWKEKDLENSTFTNLSPIQLASAFTFSFTFAFVFIWLIIFPSAGLSEHVWYESPFTPILFWSKKLHNHFSPRFDTFNSPNLDSNFISKKAEAEFNDKIENVEKENDELKDKIDKLNDMIKKVEVEKQEIATSLQRWEEEGESSKGHSPDISEDPDVKLIYYGIFSMAPLQRDRDRIRMILKHQMENYSLGSIKLVVKFIIGNNQIDNRVIDERFQNHDIVVLPIAENVNEAKTYYYFKYVLRELRDQGSNALIFKADHDTFFCAPVMLPMLEKISQDSMAYIGRINTREICGNTEWCPPAGCTAFSDDCWIYMSGGIYGLSITLLREILYGKEQEKQGVEDLTVANWIIHAGITSLVETHGHQNGEYWCHGDAGTRLWMHPKALSQCDTLLQESRNQCQK